MKSNTFVRLLALVLALLMAVPAFAMAEEEIFAEMVEEAVAAEEEFSLEFGEVIEEPVVEEAAAEEAPVEEPVVEEPAAEEPVVEEPVVEEPAAEEAPVEEPVAEEPAAEEAPAEEEAGEPAELEAAAVEEAAEEAAEESAEAPVEETVELVEEEAVELMDGETTATTATTTTTAPTATTTTTATTTPAAPTPQKYTSEVLTRNSKRTLNIGDTLQLTTATTPLSYKSSKRKVATVSSTGLVTAVKAGKAKITIRLNKKKKITMTVTVKDPYKPTKVSIGGASSVLYIGMGNPQLTANLTPAYARTTLKWKSSNKKVLRVSATGVLIPVKPGKAKITVTTANKKKASVKITVKKNIRDNINTFGKKLTAQQKQILGNDWVVGPKSIERKANGEYVVEWYLLNNIGKSKQVNNFGMDLYLNAQKVWSSVKVSSKKGTAKVFKTVYTAADILIKDPILLVNRDFSKSQWNNFFSPVNGENWTLTVATKK